jgi:hypothetical protein
VLAEDAVQQTVELQNPIHLAAFAGSLAILPELRAEVAVPEEIVPDVGVRLHPLVEDRLVERETVGMIRVDAVLVRMPAEPEIAMEIARTAQMRMFPEERLGIGTWKKYGHARFQVEGFRQLDAGAKFRGVGRHDLPVPHPFVPTRPHEPRGRRVRRLEGVEPALARFAPGKAIALHRRVSQCDEVLRIQRLVEVDSGGRVAGEWKVLEDHPVAIGTRPRERQRRRRASPGVMQPIQRAGEHAARPVADHPRLIAPEKDPERSFGQRFQIQIRRRSHHDIRGGKRFVGRNAARAHEPASGAAHGGMRAWRMECSVREGCDVHGSVSGGLHS